MKAWTDRELFELAERIEDLIEEINLASIELGMHYPAAVFPSGVLSRRMLG